MAKIDRQVVNRALAEAWELLEETLSERALTFGEPVAVQVEVDELTLRVSVDSNLPTGEVTSVQADPEPRARRRR